MRHRLLLSLSLISLAFSILIFFSPKPKPPLYPSVVPSPPRDEGGPTPTPTITPTPTPRPLTFAEMNARYGPCARISVLMYHHIDSKKSSLSVSPENFSAHLAYLKTRGYTFVPVTALNDFFNRQIPLSAKSVILTFDDAYADFAANALPILRQNSTPATVFVPTGLVNNPGYLSWQDLSSAPDYIYFANHTWSHSTKAGEIAIAQTQLADHGFNAAKIFAYPYGTATKDEVAYLSANGFTLAFTTRTGSTFCAKQRLSLPRLRAPNAPLSAIGL